MLSMAAKKVEARLEKLEWNHADLAREMEARGMHVADGLVSRWLSGKRMPGRERAIMLDRVLGIKVFHLWGVEVKERAA